MKRKLLPVLLLFNVLLAAAQKTNLAFPKTKIPLVFGPSFISDGFDNRDMAIAPSGDELFFTLQHRLFSAILYSKKKNGVWTKPEIASFSGRFNDLEPAYSPDGKKLFFTSSRPLSDTAKTAKDYDIWYLEKKEGKWVGPYNAGNAVNTAKDEYYPSLAANGTLYFTRDNGETKDDLFISVFENNAFQSPVVLPKEINSPGYDFNAFVDPAERYLLFSSYKRKDDLGGGDLYISMRKNGKWQEAIHLDSTINSSTLDYSPFVSFDGNYFFFTSKKVLPKFPYPQKKNLEEIKKLLFSYGNGSDDIYIISAEVLNKWINQ